MMEGREGVPFVARVRLGRGVFAKSSPSKDSVLPSSYINAVSSSILSSYIFEVQNEFERRQMEEKKIDMSLRVGL